LVRDDEEEEAALQFFQRGKGVSMEDHFGRRTQIPSILNQCPVPVKKMDWR
jgi:hypothetical protein